MLTPKQLLLQQTADAFRGRADMSLMAALQDVPQDVASWQADESLPSIEHLVRHVAYAKSLYCREAFGRAVAVEDPTVNANGDSPDLPVEFPCGSGWGRDASPGIAGAIELLLAAHQTLAECLEACADDAMEKPISTRHGKSAAHFFCVMQMHDTYHAGQIRTRRAMFPAKRQAATGA